MPFSVLVGVIFVLWLLYLLFARLFSQSRWIAPITFAVIAAAAVFWPSGETVGRLIDYDFAAAGAFIGSLSAALVSFFRLRRRALGGASPGHGLSASVPLRQDKSSSPAPDVFISYKRDERPQVAAIAQRLQALKLSVWFDADMRSGTTFDAEIDRKVRAAKCVLVCWSPGAIASDWVRGEATIGRGRGVLCAAMLLPCDLPAPFNLVHTNDLTAGVGPANPEWLAVLESIGALVGRPGLADYERLETTRDPAAYGAWIARFPHDPLADAVVARLKLLSA